MLTIRANFQNLSRRIQPFTQIWLPPFSSKDAIPIHGITLEHWRCITLTPVTVHRQSEVLTNRCTHIPHCRFFWPPHFNGCTFREFSVCLSSAMFSCCACCSSRHHEFCGL